MTTLARNQVDLHCHTRRSDGLMEPRDLYAAAREYGMRLVAITDHDTLDAYRELRGAGLGDAAGSAGPELIAGVEINTRAAGTEATGADELHILGHGIDPDNDAFEAILAAQRAGRRERNERIATILRQLGLPVDEFLGQILSTAVSSAGRPHLARALVQAGHADSVDEAMLRWLVPGAPAYVPRTGIGTRDAIAAIRRAGGVATLAHFAQAPTRPALLRELMEAGLRGLEVHYRAFPPATVAALVETARELALVPTGGSDYHGDTMTYAEAQDLTAVPWAVGAGLLSALERRSPAGAGERGGEGRLAGPGQLTTP